MKATNAARVVRLLMATLLVAIALLGCMLTASADDLTWNLLTDVDAGYTVIDINEKPDERGKVWREESDEFGPYIYNANGRMGALQINDEQNIFGSYQTFSVEGDFYFESFPTGIRDGKYTPEDRPLSFIAWLYNDKEGNTTNFNAIRLDSQGYIYTNTTGTSKTNVRVPSGKWVNIRCVFTPKSGQCELYIDGEKELDFMIAAFDHETRVSGAIRYFDSFYSYKARMKNLIVKTDSDYVIGKRVEEAADYVGYQTTKAEDDSFSLRAVMGVNSTEYNRIGYEVLMLEKDYNDVVTAKSISNRAKVVYESLTDAVGTVYNVQEQFGYNYAAAIEITDLPVIPEYGSFELVVRPYVLGMNGIRIYGKATILVYGMDTDENGYPVLDRRDDRFFRVEATDDAQVYNNMAHGTSIFTSDPILQGRNSDETNIDPLCAAYFKFTLSPEVAKIVDTASSAKLYICIQNLRTENPTVVVQGTKADWDETVLNAKNVQTLASMEETIAEVEVQDDLYFSVDILGYLFSAVDNEDGSRTVSFRVTQKGYGKEGEVIYFHSKESSLGLVPYIEIVSTTYEHPVNIEKYGNDGYEPWGYAEYLADWWFDDVRDKIRPVDENGNRIYYEIDEFNANGYNATTATGDFTVEMPWTGIKWGDEGATPVEKWNVNRFARTLSTLGTSTANTFLTSEYAEWIAEYDSYGGITNAGFTGQATGFFHVENHGGRPYLIDPLGNPYFAIGMNEVNIRGTQNQQDYALAKFGTKEAYHAAMSESLRAMGVNTTAAGSAIEELMADEDGLNFIISLDGVGAYMKTLGRTALAEGLMGYNNTRCAFDPGFERNSRKVIARTMEEYGYNTNPRVIGYSTDNELPNELNMLDNYLTLDPKEENTNAFSYAAAWTWLARRMNDPYPTLAKYYASPEIEEMRLEFMGFWYARYYDVMSRVIKEIAPNQMYLGSRANLNALTEEWVICAAGYYTDMITANLYGGLNPSIDTITNLYRYSGVPFMVTEFFAKGADAIDANGYLLANSTGAGILVETQQDRADYYEHYALALLESKACVGWTWYRFRDNDQSIFKQIDTGKTLYMAYVMYGASAGPISFADAEGNVYTTAQVGFYDTIYSGDGIATNQNVNKGVYNSTFSSTVTVYTYDASGKLVSSMGYDVEDPESEVLAEGTVLKSLRDDRTFTIGKTMLPDGGYTETILTVYEGKYLALANAIKQISSRVMGLVGYFDAK